MLDIPRVETDMISELTVKVVALEALIDIVLHPFPACQSPLTAVHYEGSVFFAIFFKRSLTVPLQGLSW